MRKLTLTLFILMICSCKLWSQQASITIKGTVMSATDSSALSGVTIMETGTTQGTTTDAFGRFTVRVQPGSQLEFRYIGFGSQTVALHEKRELIIYLTPAVSSNLTDVIVTTALGIKKQEKSLGYSIQEVSGKSMEKTKTPTVLGALTGKVAGLNVSNTTDFFQSPAISLRGVSPLIVIDGIPDPSADAYKINADDIESVSVLKGTAAAALYGAIGKNGAIMYTTKKGHNGTLSVEVNSSTLFQTGYTVVPKVQTQYGAGDNGKYAYMDGSGGGTEGGGWIWGPKLDQRDPNTPSGYYETTQFNSPLDTTTGELIPLPWISRGKNNIKNFFRKGLLTTNSVSATLGSEKGSFRVSAAHNYQRGVVPNTSMNNSSISLAGNYQLSPKLTVNSRLAYNREYSDNYPSIGYGPGNILYNLLLWIGADVDIRDLKNYWLPGQEGLQQRNYNLSWYNNPYFVANEYLNGYRKDNTFGNLSFQYQINPDFSAKIRSGFNVYGIDKDTKEPYSYIAYDYISKGNYMAGKTSYLDITTDVILNYEHRFSDQFKINITAGGANAYTNYKSITTSTDGLTIPGFYNLANSTNPIKATNTLQERKTNSLYGMLDLEMLKFLYLSLTGRNDWISTLPTDNNHYFYPSAGLSVVLSDAIQLPKPISFLKVRTSWAQVNSGVVSSNDPYAGILTYGIGSKWNNVPSLTWPSTAISTKLVPNTVRSLESGLTLGLFKNRLQFDATYFRNREFNNFVYVPLSEASGYTSVLENANVYLRKGWEFVISGTPVKGDKFSWETGFNFSNNHLWLDDATQSPDGYIGNLKEGDRTDRIFISNSLSSDGQVIFDANGMQATDQFDHYFGNNDPDWIYGWQNTFTYKNWSLGVSFDGRLGGLIYSTTNQKMWWGGTAPGTVNHYRDEANAGEATFVGKGVVVTGGEVKYDSHGNILSDTRQYAPNKTAVNYISYMQSTSGAEMNNYFYYSGTYLKLRELIFTYSLPNHWLKGFFKAASISLIGNNLLLLAKLPNVDPDAESDNLQSPSMRSLGINFNLKF